MDDKPEENAKQEESKEPIAEPQTDPKIEITKERQRAETQQIQANVDKNVSGPLSANAANESQDRLQPLKYEPPVKEVKTIRIKIISH